MDGRDDPLVIMSDPRRIPAATWHVPIQGGQGAQVGDHTTQHNTFQAVPGKAPQEVSAPERMHNLPPRSAVFVGRDLDHLDRLMGASRTGVVVGQVAVHGLGGIGKTELVTHFAHAVRDRYPVVWWITADKADTVTQGLVRLARRLQPTATVAYGHEWAIAWLQAHPGWLLILDNVEDIDDIRPLLGQLGGCGDVLVTTRRDPEGGGWAPLGLAPLQLEPLGRAASIELLTRITGNDDRAGADALAADLGDLPLALEQAAAYIGRHRGMDYLTYRDTLATRFDKVARHGARGGTSERSIAQVWQVTMITITGQSPLARTVLDVLAWLAPDELPQDVLYPLADDPDDVLDAVSLLADHNMIKWQDHAVSVHRLVQAVTRATHADPTDRVTGPATRAVTLLAAAIPAADPLDDVATWPRWNRLLVHIENAYEAMTADRRDPRVLELARRAAAYRQFHGQLATATTTLQQVLVDSRRVCGADHRDTLSTERRLADAYREAGRVVEAIAMLERVVAGCRRTLGRRHRHTLAARFDLATAYHHAARYDEAIDLFRRILADERGTGLGPGTLSTRHGLANAYLITGRLDVAIDIFLEVQSECRRTLGAEHPHTLISAYSLALAYQRAGRLDEALPLYEQTVATSRQVLGRCHPTTLFARYGLGSARLDAGHVEDAVSLLDGVLHDYRRVLGDHHPDTLRTWHRAARAHLAAGRVEDAVTLFEQTLAVRRQVLGGDHPDTRATVTAIRDARAELDRRR
ncbi:tetratricopeptide repeat protein [Virgisporangium ochraceum]|uniref:Tetratricopeptide repeat protein n=1 Tax=Virgisporangium ochraceum TaxID=65505 RepID=A0A8J3ZZT0_9ACTN|nr:tetratricopeptide repeat protein [Virgisporangium ochraceum]GIJ73279.1 tetratricopeptide repeat protein [Virgisporangium ochraceum]